MGKNIFIVAMLNFFLMIGILVYFSGQAQPVPLLTPTITPSPIPTSSSVSSPMPTKILITTPKPTSVVTPNPLAGRCIVVVDSVRYDVTDFRNLHSGGDIFTCGADLSQLFHNQHSQRFLGVMARYKI